MGVARSWGREEWGVNVQQGQSFSFRRWESSGDGWWGRGPSNVNVLHATELCLQMTKTTNFTLLIHCYSKRDAGPRQTGTRGPGVRGSRGLRVNLCAFLEVSDSKHVGGSTREGPEESGVATARGRGARASRLSAMSPDLSAMRPGSSQVKSLRR